MVKLSTLENSRLSISNLAMPEMSQTSEFSLRRYVSPDDWLALQISLIAEEAFDTWLLGGTMNLIAQATGYEMPKQMPSFDAWMEEAIQQLNVRFPDMENVFSQMGELRQFFGQRVDSIDVETKQKLFSLGQKKLEQLMESSNSLESQVHLLADFCRVFPELSTSLRLKIEPMVDDFLSKELQHPYTYINYMASLKILAPEKVSLTAQLHSLIQNELESQRRIFNQPGNKIAFAVVAANFAILSATDLQFTPDGLKLAFVEKDNQSALESPPLKRDF